MKIGIINGSPRGKKSNSEILIKYLCSLLEEHQINKYYLFILKIHSLFDKSSIFHMFIEEIY